MDAYCPRCRTSLPQVTDAVVQAGVCPTCGGQINVGGVNADLPLAGAIAMTFNAGSRVAVALDASFDQSQLTFGSVPSPINDEDTIRTPPPIGGKMTPRSPSPVGVATVETRPMADFPNPPKVDLPDAPDGQRPAADEPTETAAAAPGLGAHLQLPSIDFAMPDFAKSGAATTPAAAPSSDLPAHLQLPSFPDFQLPPIPGVERERTSGDFDINGVGASAGSFGAAAERGAPSVSPPPAGASASAEQWSVATAGPTPVLPPPIRTPPPLKAKPRPPAPVPAVPLGGLSNLPALGLPTLQSAAKPKEATLLGSEAAAQIVADLHKKKTSPAVYVAGILVVVVLAIGGVLAYYGPATVLGWFHAPDTRQATKSEREQADEAFVGGVKAYQAEQFNDAIKAFEKAIKLDRKHAEAHRSLGIAYAKTNQPKKAVDHYETYLKLAPDAPDAATVRKFVDEYKQAQDKGKGKRK